MWGKRNPDLTNNPLYLEPRVAAAETSLAQNGQQLTDIGINVKTFKCSDGQYVQGDGIHDDITGIQAAIDSLASTGGTVLFPKGTYLISASVKTRSYVRLVGHWKSTHIKVANGANCDAIVLYSNMEVSCTIKNIIINGNQTNNTSGRGIALINATTSLSEPKLLDVDARHTVQNVYIHRTAGDGMYVEGRGESQFDNIEILAVNGNGFVINTFDNWFSNLSVGYSGLAGIKLLAQGSTRFINCKAWMNGRLDQTKGYGFWISGTSNEFSNCEAQDNTNSGLYVDGYSNIIQGFCAEANGYNNDTATKYAVPQINIVGSYNVINAITTDRFSPPHSTEGVKFTGSRNFITVNAEGHSGVTISAGSDTTNNYHSILGHRDDTTIDKSSRIPLGYLEGFGINVAPNINIPIQVKTTQSAGNAFPVLIQQDSDTANSGSDVIIRTEKLNGSGTRLTRWEHAVDNTTKNYMIRDSDRATNARMEIRGGIKILGTYVDTLQLGSNHLWVDSTGKLRIKSSAPTSDTDGTIVGTQT